MTRNQRWQHLILLASFFVLVATGFALKYPDSWFAALLGHGRAMAQHHPSCGRSLLIADGVYHVFYIALTRMDGG